MCQIFTGLIVGCIKCLHYRKVKPLSTGARLLPVATLRRKQYGEEGCRNFEAFPSAELNRCFGYKKNIIFSLF